ncbi:MAG: hypothetical protein PHF46_00335 [Candidatus Gracilibacteria bacterium]|nr:hypothetical protein [Candidatus Gracilibacteria bacterium]MDD3119843.1 hypothetical protein [Candidatus Gracilibacteria bacterium]MDD4530700.1 hypothetical protein [Candidatus Gracilibacteria bacterium]
MEEKDLTKNEIYEMDLAILKFLKDHLLNKNLGYVDFHDEFVNFFDTYIFYFLTDPVEEIKKRIFYNIGVGFIEIKKIEKDFDEIEKKCSKKGIDQATIIIEDEDGIRIINEEEYLKNFLEIKITADGLKEIDIIKEELQKNSGLNLYINKTKEYLEKLNGMKAVVGIGITFILIILIFAFDIKVSQIIKSIPLLSSIINVEVIEQFEKLNENDEDYKTINQFLNDSRSGINKDDISKVEVKVDKNAYKKDNTNTTNINVNVSSFPLASSESTKTVDTSNSNNIKEQKERTIRITLKNGKQITIRMGKDSSKYKMTIDSLGKELEMPIVNKPVNDAINKNNDAINKGIEQPINKIRDKIANKRIDVNLNDKNIEKPDLQNQIIVRDIKPKPKIINDQNVATGKLIENSINNLQNERFMNR